VCSRARRRADGLWLDRAATPVRAPLHHPVSRRSDRRRAVCGGSARWERVDPPREGSWRGWPDQVGAVTCRTR
jgi:hypothetical protein